jgi:uncharacterized membrane protein
MQVKHWLTALAAIASALPTVVQAGVNDPYMLIYRVSGVIDDTNNAVATMITCTNYSAVTENVAIIFRSDTGASLYYSPAQVASGATIAISTHASFVYPNVINAATGAIVGGFLSVGSSTVNISCSAMMALANTHQPSGLPLHMQRFNPAANSVE